MSNGSGDWVGERRPGALRPDLAAVPRSEKIRLLRWYIIRHLANLPREEMEGIVEEARVMSLSVRVCRPSDGQLS